MIIKKVAAFLTAAVLLSGSTMFTPYEISETGTTVNASESEYEKSTQGFVTRMYNVVLNRNPDKTGLDNWTAKLNNHTLSAADIISGFFNSQEYLGKNKSIDEQINDCYNAMLGRNPDSQGKANWSERMNIGMTLNAVCNGFVGSQEFKNLCNSYGIEPGSMTMSLSRDKNYQRTYFVYRLYENCLGRTPDTAGLEDWCRKLDNGLTGSEITVGFLHSKEFKNAHYGNYEYAVILYRTMLGREPDQTGLANWVNKLNFTDTREKVANGFLFSNEFQKQCSDAGIKTGNKIPEKDSSEGWYFNIEILRLVNIERAAKGIHPLTTRQDLWEDVAMIRASEIVKSFSHTRPDGSSCFTAYDQAGIHYGYAGENIAYGHRSAEIVVNAWMNSSGHRANILDTNFSVLATGYASKYNYSQNFM